MIVFKTADGSRYGVQNENGYQTVERYGRIWVFCKTENTEVYISLDHIISITETKDE